MKNEFSLDNENFIELADETRELSEQNEKYRLYQKYFKKLGADCRKVLEMSHFSKVPVVTFGTDGSGISAKNIQVSSRIDESFEAGERFARTTAEIIENDIPLGNLDLINVIGYAPVMSALAGLAVARHFGISNQDSINRLNKKLTPVPGRLNPIAGIKGTLIIDDSYNAAPAAMQNGLDILSLFNPGEEFDRRIAVLGQMAELGKYSEDEHRLIGMKVAEVADLFVAVGERMVSATKAAVEAGMDREHVEWFEDSEAAGRYLDRVIQQGDVIYIKGSQSSRMEKAVKDIMAEPLRAEELLVRQGKGWI